MELKEFVKETLIQITDAIVEAQEVCRAKGAIVNPVMAGNKDTAMTVSNNSATIVKFHVGLCENKDSSDKRGIGVFLANLGVGYSGNDSRSNSAITTIDFSIPIKLPYSKTGKDNVDSSE